GLGPDQICDAQALIGDDSDDIPGIKGIGLKTAAELLNQFGNLETLLARAAEIKQNKRRQLIEENVDQIRMSRKLASLDENAPAEHPLEAFRVGTFDGARLIAFAKAMELDTIAKRIAKNCKLDQNTVPADPELKSKVEIKTA